MANGFHPSAGVEGAWYNSAFYCTPDLEHALSHALPVMGVADTRNWPMEAQAVPAEAVAVQQGTEGVPMQTVLVCEVILSPSMAIQPSSWIMKKEMILPRLLLVFGQASHVIGQVSTINPDVQLAIQQVADEIGVL